jgi:5-(carboxyamino)imidazole ribonucleotide mutase
MPNVAVILGSKSDREIVDASGMLEMLTGMEINWELSYISAHRNPGELDEYVMTSGAEVFIGVAGMAAALPGAIAAASNGRAAVIGVPLDEHGIDSCLYMPPGRPVLLAGVGKTGLKNAAQAAGQIVALSSPELEVSVGSFLAKLNEGKPAETMVDFYPPDSTTDEESK